MFENNWFLFLLIVMLTFFADGEISKTEASVMLGILCALCFCGDPCSGDSNTETAENCFCNHSV